MSKKNILALLVAFMSLFLLVGCGSKDNPAAMKKEVKVNAYQVQPMNVTINNSFTGTIKAVESVPIRAKVTGYIVQKMVHGGQAVKQGQPLYRIDPRSYYSSYVAAKANAAQAGVAAQNAQVDLNRYEYLAKNDAIADQVVDGQRAKAAQASAAYEAAVAQAKVAGDTLEDTIVRAPFSGTLSMNDIDMGAFVAAGQTPLVTIESTTPVFFEFNMGQKEYDELTKVAKDGNIKNIPQVALKLSNGDIYKYYGRIVEVSSNLDSSSGQIVAKAIFQNPEQSLLPGMFATLITTGQAYNHVLMVPTKSIVQVLDKFFVMIVDSDGKVRQEPITKGPESGPMTIVSGKIKAGDQVIVDGLTKVHTGDTVTVNLLSLEEVNSDK